MVKAMTSAEKTQLSAAWLTQLATAVVSDPWIHGFSVVLLGGEQVVGSAGYKGPPGADGTVEIAYGVDADHQGRGYATEAAEALVSYAFARGVRVARAHTLPESNASTRVLEKCGFRKIEEVMDPEDGLVWRWEKAKGKL